MNLSNPSRSQLAAIRAALFCLCISPAAYHLWGWFNDALGANPVEAITRGSGEWALRFLLLTLLVTPLRKLSGLHWLIRLRRMLGLFTFAYATTHLLTYLWLDQFFAWQAIVDDIVDRPFITVGFAAFVLLIPLALTSTQSAMKRMGGRAWQSLHRSIYPISIMVMLHYWWMVRADFLEASMYVLILAVLLGLRVWWREQERRRQLSAPAPGERFKGKVIHIVPK